jgi:hypothetical protein
MTYTIADHHGSQLTREETEWPGFSDRQEYCGQINLIAAWAVPNGIHEQMELPKHISLYITSVGQWAPTIEIAEHYLSRTEPPTEFRVKGASLGLFVSGAWADDNGSPNVYSDYRVYQRSPGCWDAEEIEEAPPELVGAVDFEYF